MLRGDVLDCMVCSDDTWRESKWSEEYLHRA